MEGRSKELGQGEVTEVEESFKNGNKRELEFVVPGSTTESEAEDIMNQIGKAIFLWEPFYVNDSIRVKLTATYEPEDK